MGQQNKYIESQYHSLVNCHSILIKRINLLNIAEMNYNVIFAMLQM